MAQMPNRQFSQGQQVWLADGRSGVILRAVFNDDGGFWEYGVEGLEFTQAEFNLLASDPAVQVEPEPEIQIPPPEEAIEDVSFITREDLRDLVIAIVADLPRGEVTQVDLDAAVNAGVERSNLIAQSNLQTQIAGISATAVALAEDLESRFQDLASAATTTLSEIEKRGTDIEAAAQESGGLGFLGFVGGLGGLLRNPVTWIMDRLGDHIVEEIKDGLNR